MRENTAGERLFARCAHAPNAKGFCGPRDTDLEAVAVGGRGDVLSAARRFSGVWVYLEAAARQVELADPLALALVQAYWFGTPMPAGFSRHTFARDLVARFAQQAGAYWQHLTPALEAEVEPTHGFHVFGVYPWSRLLSESAPEPLSVLEECRLTPARVLEVGPPKGQPTGSATQNSGDAHRQQLLVSASSLSFSDGVLSCGPERERWVDFALPSGTFFDTPPQPGDAVALHWSFACTALTAQQAEALRADTVRQVARVNERLQAG